MALDGGHCDGVWGRWFSSSEGLHDDMKRAYPSCLRTEENSGTPHSCRPVNIYKIVILQWKVSFLSCALFYIEDLYILLVHQVFCRLGPHITGGLDWPAELRPTLFRHFRKIAKPTVSYVMSVSPSVRLSAWNISLPAVRIFMIFIFEYFLKSCYEN